MSDDIVPTVIHILKGHGIEMGKVRRYVNLY